MWIFTEHFSFNIIFYLEIQPFNFQKPSTNTTMWSKYSSSSFASATVNAKITPTSSFGFMMRTRAADGLVALLLSSVPSKPEDSYSFISVEVKNGQFVLKHGAKSEKVVDLINDGKWHEVVIYSSNVTIDGTDIGDPVQGEMMVKKIFMGGVDDPTIYKDKIGVVQEYDGCIQAVSLKGSYLTNEAIPELNTTKLATNVSMGCKGSDVCGPKPCLYDGNCTDIWNEFECDCRKGFDGRTCDIYGCKLSHSCIKPDVCVDLPLKVGETTCK